MRQRFLAPLDRLTRHFRGPLPLWADGHIHLHGGAHIHDFCFLPYGEVLHAAQPLATGFEQVHVASISPQVFKVEKRIVSVQLKTDAVCGIGGDGRKLDHLNLGRFRT